MNRTPALIAVLIAALAACASAQAAPVITPFATDLGAASYSADAAAGGSSAQSVFNGGYWNAGSHGVHWVQADMGSTQTLSEVRLTIDVMPWTSTWQEVYLSDTPIGNLYSLLTPVVGRTGYTSQYQQFVLNFAASAGRYIQVVSYGGASWTAMGDGSGRSNWTDTGATASQVPEPGSLALVLGALGALGTLAARGRRHAAAALRRNRATRA